MCYINKLAMPILLIKAIVIILFVYILIPLLTVNKRENVSTVCSGAAIFFFFFFFGLSVTQITHNSTYV